MATPVPLNKLPAALRPVKGKPVPLDKLPESLRPEKEAAGFFGALSEATTQFPEIADEAAAFAADPSEKNRRALIKAGESEYRKVDFGEGENWEAFKQLLGTSLGGLVAPVAAGFAGSIASPIGGLVAASGVSGAQYTSQNLLRQAQEQERAIAEGKKPEETSLGKAVLAATGQTALDVAGGRVFTGIAKAFPFMRPLLGEGSKKATEKAGEVLADAAEKGTIKFAGGVAKGVGKGVAFEVPQEIAQQGIERWQAGLSLIDDEAQSEYKQAAIGALLLGGGFGGISGAIEARRTEAPEAGEAATEEAALSEGRSDLQAFRKDVTARLAKAAGPEISERGNKAVTALGRLVSNDIATATPESLDRAETYIRDREDQLDAGMDLEPDVADPLRRPVLNEDGTPVVNETTGAPVYEGALVEAKRMLAEARERLDAGATEKAAPTTAVWASKDTDYNVEILPDDPVAGPDGRMYQHVSYEGKNTYVPLDELRFEPATPPPTASAQAEAGETPNTFRTATTINDQTEVVEGVTRPTTQPGIEPTPVQPTAQPEVPPQEQVAVKTTVPKMEIAADWRVKYADQFGQSQLADNWAKSVLGTGTPSELQTTPIIERAITMQAGQQRQLQRNQFDPLVEAIGNTKADLGDFNYFLWLRAAEGRNKSVAEINPEFPEGGAGVTTAEAQAGLQDIKDEGLLPKYNLLAKKVDNLVDFNLAEDVKAGLLSKEQAKELREKQPFYVPLKGFAADGDIMTSDIDEDAHSTVRREEAMQALRAASPSGNVREYRRAFGRGSMPFAPLFNLMQDSEQRVRRRVLNKARLPILKQYKKNPAAFEGIFNVYSHGNPKKIPVGRDMGGTKYVPVPNMEKEYYANPGKYMMVKDNGVAHYIEFSDSPEGQALRRMFDNLDPKDMEGAAQVAAEVNNFLKGMLTYKNPLYLLFVAPPRDFSSAIATAMYHQNLKGSPAYKKNLAARTAFYGLPFTGTWGTIAKFVFTNKPLDTKVGRQLDDMIREGGATLNTRFLNAREKAQVADQSIRKMKGIENLSAKERGTVILEGLNKWIDGLADLMDISARFATYRAAVDLGIQPADASRLALDSSLNLTRRGEKARSLDLVFPFFGAGVEAARKTKRIYTSKGGAKVLGALLAYGALESLWNAARSGDDDEDGKEDYLNLDSSGMRMNRLTIYYGEGADDYVKVPIDPMVGYFKFVGNRIGDLMADTITPGEATGGLLTGAISLMSPVRIPQADLPSAAVAFTPLVGKPIMENLLNQNFFGGPIYQESVFDNAPASELGRPTTGEGWKWLAQTMNEVTGGSAAVKGKIDLQPEIYRQLIEGWLGGPYQLAKQVAGLPEAEGAADIPGLKSFVGTGSEYAPQTQYFENSTVIRQIMNRFNKLTPEQQAEQATEYFMDTDPRVVEAYQIVDKELDRLNKEQRELLGVTTSDEDKQMVLDHYRAEKNKLYSAFNYIYRDVKRGGGE